MYVRQRNRLPNEGVNKKERETGALQAYLHPSGTSALLVAVRKLENSACDKYLVIVLGWTGVISKPLIAARRSRGYVDQIPSAELNYLLKL